MNKINHKNESDQNNWKVKFEELDKKQLRDEDGIRIHIKSLVEKELNILKNQQNEELQKYENELNLIME